ncbi:MAG: hypothetical protein DWQ31_05570 [Planctomycetota bacterium]|nr:MAG: hypothetical protein DWQ31_05570 [Planctomycetota bacterium]REJ92981.1 MAG: hypothetical protein DWQ35_11120 [Planctomycetota bacterium]
MRLFAVAAGVTLGLVIIVLLSRDSTPTLTRAKLDEAYQRWRDHGPTSYNMELATTGSRKDKIRVKVRDGAVTAMSINDYDFPADRLTDTWTVPGQFEYMRSDLKAAASPEYSAVMRLSAEFDEEFGFPRIYRCTAGGKRAPVSWKVHRFESLAP